MRSSTSKWLSGIGAVLVVGGLVLAGSGSGGTPVWADDNHKGNPFTKILGKLDQILAAIGGLRDGGQDGNQTLRWDQALPAAQRFVVLASFANAAVLDKETGLVWEQSPETTTYDWANARYQCINRTTGGRKGWRLPSVHELASLVDPSVAPPGPTLPAGHPFTNVQSAAYWSASTNAQDPPRAFYVVFGNGGVTSSMKINSQPVWCVRGGHNDGSEY